MTVDPPPDHAPFVTAPATASGARGSVITVSGEVKNVSQEKIEHIIAVADFGIANGRIVKTAEAPVLYQPVMAGQTTPFRVTIPDNPAIFNYRVIFKDAAGAIIRATAAETQQ